MPASNVPAASWEAPPPRSLAIEIAIVAGILLALLMGALDNFVVLTALPSIITDLNGPSSGETFIVSAYLISSTVAIPIFGKLSDLFDRKQIFIAGLLVFIAGSVLAGISQSFNELVAFRAVQGFGSGAFFPVGIAIVAVIFPPETRARVTGLLSGVFGIATVAGPLLGNFIVSSTTWRWVFYVNIPVGLAGLLVLLFALAPLRPERMRSFDVIGAALLVGWVSTLMFPLVEISEQNAGWTDVSTIVLLASAVILVIGFVLWELRDANPLVPLRLLRERIVGASASTTFMVGAIVFPLATLITTFVQGVTYGGIGDPSAAIRDILYFLVIPLVIGAFLGGNLLARFAYRPVVLAGVLISVVGMVFLIPVGASTPLWTLWAGVLPVGGLALPLIPIGFGVGLTFPVFLLAVQNQVAEADVGAASGLVQFFQSLGGALGLTLLSTYQQAVYGHPASFSVDALASSYSAVFTVMLALLVISAITALFIAGRMPTKSAKSAGFGAA